MDFSVENTKCWSQLLGHITGFAAINAWGELQQEYKGNSYAAISCAVLAFATHRWVPKHIPQFASLATGAARVDIPMPNLPRWNHIADFIRLVYLF